ncbi:replication associated protein [Lake Sarah-associated circular virus-1]|uniref:replication associated protein n=1 Tax=Lake Sarah-associated circular virus-1 TaxID=1685735 RepID=UPI0007776D06|nr:replication associated protein [Lake Sarah-associated circular virus-1]ALE29569.1 replication associated protein [Lake Sarah-associated circular virus-1]ALE29571.1 replication associated protein [Lake Sarah-associated circular virus-1]ALE29573.1 replication associated protein [Lake Sarah-associated circular virus-1]ALE29575.1 replication associated protein [Lake Sarah-associated circular virus-1]
MSQGIYWLLTINQHEFVPYLPAGVSYIRGQLEMANNQGADTGYLHWQLLVVFSRKCRLAAVKKLLGNTVHAELSRSAAATDYVWKEDTRVAGTQFELGAMPMQRNNPTDWDTVRNNARAGRLGDISGDIYVRCYNQLKRIACDHMQADPVEREVVCYWGRTGTGKSRRAWDEASLDAYPKDPRSKFWDGYRGQEHVVLDEFRGGIDIAHVLRWFDRYPVMVEVKGSSVPLKATKIWITSNLPPESWYPELDDETKQALRRRMNITHFI